MTITATRLAAQHRGSTAANTRTHSGLSFVSGRRYLVIVEALQNGTGSWATESTFEVTDDHADSTWTTVAVSADPGSTAGGTNGTAICAALSSTIVSSDATVAVTIDFANDDATQYLSVETIYELSSDVGDIELVQVAGAAGGTAPDLDWPSAPAASSFQVVAWSTVHNSTASFPTEPTGYTADYTNVTSVCAIEVQTADGVTTDPVSFTPTVSGTQFSFHVVGLELTDDAAGVSGTGALTAPAATAASTGALTASGAGAPAAPPATALATGATTVATAGNGPAPPSTAAGSASTAVDASGTGTASPAALAGTGTTAASATGTTTAPTATASAAGTAPISSTGALTAPAGAAVAVGATSTTGAGAAAPAPGDLAGSGTTNSDTPTGAATVTAPPTTTTGAGTVALAATGAAVAASPATAGSGSLVVASTGALTAPASAVVGVAPGDSPASIDVAHGARPDGPRHVVEPRTRHAVHLGTDRHAVQPAS